MSELLGLIADTVGSLFSTNQKANKNIEGLKKYEWFMVLYQERGCREIIEKSDAVRVLIASIELKEIEGNSRKRAFFHEALINKINEQIHAPL